MKLVFLCCLLAVNCFTFDDFEDHHIVSDMTDIVDVMLSTEDEEPEYQEAESKFKWWLDHF